METHPTLLTTLDSRSAKELSKRTAVRAREHQEAGGLHTISWPLAGQRMAAVGGVHAAESAVVRAAAAARLVSAGAGARLATV